MGTASLKGTGRRARRTDWSLIMVIGGALVLIVAGLISIPLVARRPPTLSPITTPEGVVQRFYQAAYQGDYATAYMFLSTDTQGMLPLSELQQQMQYDLQNSHMRVATSTVHDSTATVRVTITHVQPGGVFGGGEWNVEQEVLLQREGDTWKIVSGPFYVPVPQR